MSSLHYRLRPSGFETIVKHLTGLMSRQDAEERRERLMTERKFFIRGANEHYFERPFSLCEH